MPTPTQLPEGDWMVYMRTSDHRHISNFGLLRLILGYDRVQTHTQFKLESRPDATFQMSHHCFGRQCYASVLDNSNDYAGPRPRNVADALAAVDIDQCKANSPRTIFEFFADESSGNDQELNDNNNVLQLVYIQTESIFYICNT